MTASQGMKVQTVVINDDVSVENSLYTAGRRGLGTTVATKDDANTSE
jgi:phosphoenolpyruvate---glycerone phosphotransferase subunit DhaK